MWILYGILSAITAAIMTIIAKLGLKKIDPTLATTIRSLIMFAFMFITALVLQKHKLLGQINSSALWAIIISAIFGALSWLFYFLALKEGPASKVAALDRLSLALVVVMAIFFLSEKLTWQTGVGALLMTIGAAIMII
ncbi:EamA family transporter [Patescibacteria group bacterium]|nr:EamA family transporter [Patescibacteria group bacterium]